MMICYDRSKRENSKFLLEFIKQINYYDTNSMRSDLERYFQWVSILIFSWHPYKQLDTVYTQISFFVTTVALLLHRKMYFLLG